MKIKIFLLSLIFTSFFCDAQVKLKPFKKFHTNVPEPSDIVYSPDFSQFYIASDQGILYVTDTLGKKVKQAANEGLDFEGVWADDKFIFIADERARRVLVYDQTDLKVVRQNEIAYGGGMNAGYEGITYNAKKNCYVVVTEKNPIWFYELNADFVKINEVKRNIASDVSSICFHNDFMYALSDEDQCVLKLDPVTYEVLMKWKIPVTNPEGMTFDKQGHLVVVSDFEQSIFKFQLTDSLK
ncbi:MAG: SdiA-regulated domain-containing protein [Bacteroidia bacterium]